MTKWHSPNSKANLVRISKKRTWMEIGKGTATHVFKTAFPDTIPPGFSPLASPLSHPKGRSPSLLDLQSPVLLSPKQLQCLQNYSPFLSDERYCVLNRPFSLYTYSIPTAIYLRSRRIPPLSPETGVLVFYRYLFLRRIPSQPWTTLLYLYSIVNESILHGKEKLQVDWKGTP